MEIAQFGFIQNKIPIQEANITDVFTVHPYYVRFKEEAAAKKILEDLSIQYDVFKGDHAFTIQTEPLTNNQREALFDNAEIGAIYRIIREDN